MFLVSLHHDVVKFLDELSEVERKRCVDSLKKLGEDPFTPRSGVSIKKLKGEKRTMYRLRVGDIRFEYFVDGKTVYVVEAFRRGRGYR